jgi:predicted enzyme related to lactoylglutathione lyase
MGRPVHFEIHVDDIERARGFYEKLFGWSFQKWGEADYYVVTTGEGTAGINGGMLPRQAGGERVNGWVNTVSVDDLDSCLALVEANGGTIALPKQPMEGIGWVAYAIDSEGNLFGMIEEVAAG